MKRHGTDTIEFRDKAITNFHEESVTMSRVMQSVLIVCLIVAPQLGAQQTGPVMDGASIQRIVEGFIGDCNYDAIPETWDSQLPMTPFADLRLKDLVTDGTDDYLAIDLVVTGVNAEALSRWKSLWRKQAAMAPTPDFPERAFSRKNERGEKEDVNLSIAVRENEATITCTVNRSDVRAAADARMTAAIAETAEAVEALGVTPAVERLIDIVVANRPLSPTAVRTLSKAERRVLRNAVYARHGRPFKDAGLNAYFQSKSWYQARPTFSEAQLTATDQANIRLLPP